MDDWAAIFETNTIGMMRVTHSILPDMVRRNTGDIVNMSSINALRIVPDMAPYSASKAAVSMLTQTIRGELAQRNTSTSSRWRSSRRTSPAASCLRSASRALCRSRRW